MTRPRRLVLVEALSAGAGALDPALAAEGRAMRDTLAADLHGLPGLDLAVALGPGERRPPGAPGRDEPARPGEAMAARLHRLARAHDAVWGIAPETGGVLAAWAEAVEAAGAARWLGGRPPALRQAGSKNATVAAWRAAGLDTPWEAGGPAWVVKPDDGAGALRTHRWPDRAAAEAEAAARRAAGEPVCLEPHVAGEPVSLALEVRPGPAGRAAVRLLACNRQAVAWRPAGPAEGAAAAGAEVAEAGPVAAGALDADPRRPAWAAWADRAVQALPGLAGWVGIDAILRPDGRLVGLELNPRLTSAYIGLPAGRRRALLPGLLAAAGLEAPAHA